MNDIIFNQEIFIYIYSFYTNTVSILTTILISQRESLQNFIHH